MLFLPNTCLAQESSLQKHHQRSLGKFHTRDYFLQKFHAFVNVAMNKWLRFLMGRSKGHDMLAPFTAGWQSADLDPLIIAKSEVTPLLFWFIRQCSYKKVCDISFPFILLTGELCVWWPWEEVSWLSRWSMVYCLRYIVPSVTTLLTWCFSFFLFVYFAIPRIFVKVLALIPQHLAGGNEPRLVSAAVGQLNTLPFYHSFWNRTTKPSLVRLFTSAVLLLIMFFLYILLCN